MAITQRVQFDIPYETYLRLLRHPDCPGWRGRNEFFCKVLLNGVDSSEFKLKELEHRIRQVERERDQARRALEQKVKSDEFLKRVQSGEFSRSLAAKQETETTIPAPSPIGSGPDSVH